MSSNTSGNFLNMADFGPIHVADEALTQPLRCVWFADAIYITENGEGNLLQPIATGKTVAKAKVNLWHKIIYADNVFKVTAIGEYLVLEIDGWHELPKEDHFKFFHDYPTPSKPLL